MTSGYNSDAISDHDYENIRVNSSNSQPIQATQREAQEEEEEGYVEEDDNYVILENMKKDDTNADVIWEVSYILKSYQGQYTFMSIGSW